ncbi:MAG TPA: hybrid sensor histidine kinase/response regulator [Ktedonobacteraceae bacterium]|nr:hybrid sensor histidine kinase/response regulator [Ktedonobacteraceae bacterium]
MHDKPNILIVDDDAALLQAMPQALSLRLTAIQVDTSDSALEALDLIKEHDYDAIVSDIKMPGMDGLALLAKVQEYRPETPTLLITGHGEHDLAVQALRGGAYDFIQKPIDRDYMVAALSRAIQTCRLRREVAENQRALELHNLSLERIVQNRTRELVDANAAKDKFLGMVSHELKTPLTTLKGRAQLLLRQTRREMGENIVTAGLEDIERSINRLQVLVDDLLDASLVDTNMFVIHRRRCNLVELCRKLLNEFISDDRPSLHFESPGEAIEAEVDADRIGQVLLNLLSNARKYSPEGYPITVTLQRVGFEAIISVRDMGEGIPSEALPHIFDQYYRAPGVKVRAGSHNGLGLGLFISQKLVERHAGRIEVQSEPDQGSIFSVHLPIFVDPTVEEIETTNLAPHAQAVWTILH